MTTEVAVAAFVPGIELCGAFYREVVAPIVEVACPGLRYGAALIGDGSEVLGFDTEMSTDHAWAARVMLFLPEDEVDAREGPIRDALRAKLPAEFRGRAVKVPWPEPPLRDRVDVTTLESFFRSYLDFDVRSEPRPADWLTFSEQKLLAITAGAVYHDEVGLQAARYRFAYYPHDVWLYLLAAGWTRIGQEEHLMGRAGFVGDEVGSAIIGARLVRDVMRLCFLMERRYAPYPKWFGTAFARLGCAATLTPSLQAALAATCWQEREKHLCAAYEAIARLHNGLGVTRPVPETVVQFHERPFRVIEFDGRFSETIRAAIQDPEVRRIAERRLIGSIDQFSDSTDLVSCASWRPTLRRLYEPDPVGGRTRWDQ